MARLVSKWSEAPYGLLNLLRRSFYRDSDRPASIGYRQDGSISWQGWYQNCQQHRESDLPAAIDYRPDGSIACQYWYQNDNLHRDSDLPAGITYYKDGSILSRWYLHGKYQRETKEYPEPALEDLVKPAFCLQEPAFSLLVSRGDKVTEPQQESSYMLDEE